MNSEVFFLLLSGLSLGFALLCHPERSDGSLPLKSEILTALACSASVASLRTTSESPKIKIYRYFER